MNYPAIQRLKNIRAFTMVELMGAVTIALILIIMLYSIFDKVQRVFVTGQSRAVAMDESRAAMDILMDDFRFLNRYADVNGDIKNLEWMPETRISDLTYPMPPPVPGIANEALIKSPFKVAIEGTTTAPIVGCTHVPVHYGEVPNGLRPPDSAVLKLEPLRQKYSDGCVNFIDEPNGPDAFITYGNPPSGGLPNEYPSGSRLELYHHNIRFFTNDGGAWRLVHYKFGPREKYFMPLSTLDGPGNEVDMLDSPVGALWVYRSDPTFKGDMNRGLVDKINEHENFQRMEIPKLWNSAATYDQGDMVLYQYDKNFYQAIVNGLSVTWGHPPKNPGGWAKLNSGGLDAPMGFSRLIDGVIHFRVRAADPNNPDRDLREYTKSENPFTGYQMPTHVVVEIAILDGKLLKEVENKMGQELEEVELSAAEEGRVLSPLDRERRRAAKRCELRLKKIKENLHQVYFFKQLVKVRN